MEFDKVIKMRTATRKFSDKKVEKEKLDKILEAGRIAPTAKNLQPIKIYVIESEEGLEKLDKASPCRYNSRTCLLVCGDKDSAFQSDDFSSYEMDACIVSTHMMLEATNQGVDNIWIRFFNPSILRQEFNIHNNLISLCLFPLGYRAIDCPKNKMHEERKKIDELVIYK